MINKEMKMKRFLPILNRTILGALLVVALSPCFVCGQADCGPGAKGAGCSMPQCDGKGDCCHHGKTNSTFFKALNQSALPAKQPAKAAVSSLAPYAVVPLGIASAALSVSGSFSRLDTPPPHTLILRI